MPYRFDGKTVFNGRTVGKIVLAAGVVAAIGTLAVAGRRKDALSDRLPTGKRILVDPNDGSQIPVGSFPANLALSQDGKWIAVTNTGFRQQISLIGAADGRLTSALTFGGEGGKSAPALYYGLAFAPVAADGYTLYASRGPEDTVSILHVTPDGKLSDTGRTLADPSSLPAEAKGLRSNFIAGIALSGNGSLLYAAHNETSAYTGQKGSVSVLDTDRNKVLGRVETAGFPYAVAAITRGGNADRKLYVSSERDGVVSVIDVHDPAHPIHRSDIKVGDHPMALRLNAAQDRLFVACASSDTVAIVNTESDRLLNSFSLRGRSRLPGWTPTGLDLSPDGKQLYVALGDMNAVATLDLQGDRLSLHGLMPTGWYPTSVAAAPDGRTLYVANAKGAKAFNPNGTKVGPDGVWGQYIENIIEGSVQRLLVPTEEALKGLTRQVTYANAPSDIDDRPLLPPGIKHAIYIIKENRTYDQVLGDLKQGNGDPALCLFGRDVTPNLHALAERFVLLDNFYCCGEVSADGWPWSTSGMSSEYTERNVPFNYSGRGRSYDFEGTTNNLPVDLMNLPDVARAPGGFLWDAAAKKGLSYRNYGFFVAFADLKTPDGKLVLSENRPVTRTLSGHTDIDFLRFSTEYADSDAWQTYRCPAPTQRKSYGKFNAPSRFSEWKREFDTYVRSGNLPAFEMVRLMRDHTDGDTPGVSSPRAMVADNDYAVGQLVDAVSHSPFWKETAIFIVEDDAQDGYDHVDAHRSIAFVISPFVRRSLVDHHFYNTDSTLHTMEGLLGLKPMCQYDAIAPQLQVFEPEPDNDMPYQAVLPARAIVAEVNTKTAYRAAESRKLDMSRADQAPPGMMADILWHSVKGAHAPVPRHAGLLHADVKEDRD